jgi:aryl-alcohol dehydrogenase-like predicted oxidoreductase
VSAPSLAARLALGTVQFGLPYGVANTQGQVSEAVARQMLDRAAEAGVRVLDTAIAYGSSEACLGRIGVGHFEVVTKLPALPIGVDVARWVGEALRASRDRLGLAHLPVVLLHRSADLLDAACREALAGWFERGEVGALGVSIYDPAELDAVWPVFKPAVVQAPFNVLDRRLVASGWLSRLHAEGVRVMSRSAFLQGLLLMPAHARPAYFKPWAGLLDGWLAACAHAGKTALEAALAFVLSEPRIERVIVGADSLVHLEEILAAAIAPASPLPLPLHSNEVALIDPSRWNLT